MLPCSFECTVRFIVDNHKNRCPRSAPVIREYASDAVHNSRALMKCAIESLTSMSPGRTGLSRRGAHRPTCFARQLGQVHARAANYRLTVSNLRGTKNFAEYSKARSTRTARNVRCCIRETPAVMRLLTRSGKERGRNLEKYENGTGKTRVSTSPGVAKT